MFAGRRQSSLILRSRWLVQRTMPSIGKPLVSHGQKCDHRTRRRPCSSKDRKRTKQNKKVKISISGGHTRQTGFELKFFFPSLYVIQLGEGRHLFIYLFIYF